jgi:hypothetical protein
MSLDPNRNRAEPVIRQAKDLIVHQGVADELRRLVIGNGIAVEIIGQVDLAERKPQSLVRRFRCESRLHAFAAVIR